MKSKADNYFLKSFEEIGLIGKHFNVYDSEHNLVFKNCYINDRGYVCYGEDDRELWAATMELLTGDSYYEIITNKKKLRDLAPEEYKKWLNKNCSNLSCKDCVFLKAKCNTNSIGCWINHKDAYSEKFLNQEIEVEE